MTSHLPADCFSVSCCSKPWEHTVGECKLGCLAILNVISDDACGAKLSLTGSYFFFPPMDGHHGCRPWNKHGREVEWNGWWQNLNANGNEAGFGEMLNVLYSRVVIWNHNLLLRFPLHAGARNRSGGASAVASHSRQYLDKKHMKGRRLRDLKKVAPHFPTSPPWVLSTRDSIDITNSAVL